MALLKPKGKVHNARCYFFFFWVQHTNCCNCRSLVTDVLGANILDSLGINSLWSGRKKKIYIYINGLLSLQVKLTEQ